MSHDQPSVGETKLISVFSGANLRLFHPRKVGSIVEEWLTVFAREISQVSLITDNEAETTDNTDL